MSFGLRTFSSSSIIVSLFRFARTLFSCRGGVNIGVGVGVGGGEGVLAAGEVAEGFGSADGEGVGGAVGQQLVGDLLDGCFEVFGIGAVEEAEGALAAALEQYDVARRTAEQLGSKSWVADIGAATDRVKRQLGTSGVAQGTDAGR